MKIFFYCITIVTGLLLSLCGHLSYAQTDQQKLTATILHLDSLFWGAYNNCDTAKFKDFFTDDVEFYHDKGGATLGNEELTATFKKNVCGNRDFRLRRQAIDSTVKVYPMQKGSEIYGAIISGEHLFYILEKAKDEYLDGHASFSHLWFLKDGVWKMARVLSYDHHPAEYLNQRKEIKLSHDSLDRFAGSYKGPQSGAMKVERENDWLNLYIGNKTIRLYPQSENIFFTKDRDLTFEFIKNTNNKITKLVVREHGAIAEEAISENSLHE